MIATLSEIPNRSLDASVIVVTLNRLDCLERCLNCLAAQTLAPAQVIVVDGSPDAGSRAVVESFADVLYLQNPMGYGHMTVSRNIGLLHCTGDIIAMIDDDSFANPEWLENLIKPYSDPKVGGVGGRALNSITDETQMPIEEIGRLKPNGYLAANFNVDPGKIIDVDHIVGCNMSFRRDVLARLGGLRDDFPGTEVGEDTDISLRVRQLGYRIVFNPAAVLLHIGAPQAKGKRFNARYEFYHRRNNFVLLIRNFGPAAIVWRYLFRTSRDACFDCLRKIGGAIIRVAANFAGATVGIVAGLAMNIRHGRNPVRSDARGKEITGALTGGTAADQPREIASESSRL